MDIESVTNDARRDDNGPKSEYDSDVSMENATPVSSVKSRVGICDESTGPTGTVIKERYGEDENEGARMRTRRGRLSLSDECETLGAGPTTTGTPDKKHGGSIATSPSGGSGKKEALRLARQKAKDWAEQLARAKKASSPTIKKQEHTGDGHEKDDPTVSQLGKHSSYPRAAKRTSEKRTCASPSSLSKECEVSEAGPTGTPVTKRGQLVQSSPNDGSAKKEALLLARQKAKEWAEKTTTTTGTSPATISQLVRIDSPAGATKESSKKEILESPSSCTKSRMGFTCQLSPKSPNDGGGNKEKLRLARQKAKDWAEKKRSTKDNSPPIKNKKSVLSERVNSVPSVVCMSSHATGNEPSTSTRDCPSPITYTSEVHGKVTRRSARQKARKCDEEEEAFSDTSPTIKTPKREKGHTLDECDFTASRPGRNSSSSASSSKKRTRDSISSEEESYLLETGPEGTPVTGCCKVPRTSADGDSGKKELSRSKQEGVEWAMTRGLDDSPSPLKTRKRNDDDKDKDDCHSSPRSPNKSSGKKEALQLARLKAKEWAVRTLDGNSPATITRKYKEIDEEVDRVLAKIAPSRPSCSNSSSPRGACEPSPEDQRQHGTHRADMVTDRDEVIPHFGDENTSVDWTNIEGPITISEGPF